MSARMSAHAYAHVPPCTVQSGDRLSGMAWPQWLDDECQSAFMMAAQQKGDLVFVAPKVAAVFLKKGNGAAGRRPTAGSAGMGAALGFRTVFA